MASETTETARQAETASEAEPAGERPAARSRQRLRLQTIRNMVLSMAIICLGAFAMYFFIPHDESIDPVREVEYDVAASTAARVAPYELLAPEGLPEDWRATSVRYEPQGEFGATWRLGMMNPEDEYVALAQSDAVVGGPEPFLASVTQNAEDTGETVSAAGRDWARYEGDRYDALVLQEPEVTTVVFGTAATDRLVAFAEALEVRAR
ncbi:DUF4245 domain-containing protein [Streptomyces millisiae]|uniref:DUF4245 domain-containing protein n=1 Tax=Streptomyces millisiae TaxID=3075542 RepID=A0ABU2LUZ5_9ACTN|nr:DUF4245 domain-containing protein [Streptomyces sp. DSM 44918]MDT0320997.1 DUF4245 domain-containing protein [Streptomyces sp. DSM 44918]